PPRPARARRRRRPPRRRRDGLAARPARPRPRPHPPTPPPRPRPLGRSLGPPDLARVSTPHGDTPRKPRECRHSPEEKEVAGRPVGTGRGRKRGGGPLELLPGRLVGVGPAVVVRQGEPRGGVL